MHETLFFFGYNKIYQHQLTRILSALFVGYSKKKNQCNTLDFLNGLALKYSFFFLPLIKNHVTVFLLYFIMHPLVPQMFLNFDII